MFNAGIPDDSLAQIQNRLEPGEQLLACHDLEKRSSREPGDVTTLGVTDRHLYSFGFRSRIFKEWEAELVAVGSARLVKPRRHH